MNEVLMRAIDDRNRELMQEILLKITYFKEHQEDLGKICFEELLFSVQYQQVKECKPIELDLALSPVYVFMEKGVIVSRKPCKDFQQRISKPLGGKRGSIKETKVQTDSIPVRAYEIYNQYTQKLYGNCVYVPNKNTIVLKLADLNKSVEKQIRQRLHEKIKLLNNMYIFEEIPKCFIAPFVNFFKFLKITFQQYVFKASTKKNQVFFLASGQVEVRLADDHKKKVESPSILGWPYPQYQEEVEALCVTQKCICYVCSSDVIANILHKYSETYDKTNPFLETLREKAHEQKSLVTSSVNGENQQPSQDIQKLLRRTTFQPRQNSSVLNSPSPKRNGNSVSNSKCSPNLKQLRIREYFSNNLNEQFELYQEKKLEQFKCPLNEPVILFRMKGVKLLPQASDHTMDRHSKRKNRIERFKEEVIRYNQQAECQQLRAACEYDQKIEHSIRKKLNFRLTQQLKKKHLFQFR